MSFDTWKRATKKRSERARSSVAILQIVHATLEMERQAKSGIPIVGLRRNKYHYNVYPLAETSTDARKSRNTLRPARYEDKSEQVRYDIKTRDRLYAETGWQKYSPCGTKCNKFYS